jgi:hypothetical protein
MHILSLNFIVLKLKYFEIHHEIRVVIITSIRTIWRWRSEFRVESKATPTAKVDAACHYRNATHHKNDSSSWTVAILHKKRGYLSRILYKDLSPC